MPPFVVPFFSVCFDSKKTDEFSTRGEDAKLTAGRLKGEGSGVLICRMVFVLSDRTVMLQLLSMSSMEG